MNDVIFCVRLKKGLLALGGKIVFRGTIGECQEYILKNMDMLKKDQEFIVHIDKEI